MHRPEREQALAKTALALMSECAVTPTPDNFELFYTYASGDKPEIGRLMGEIISARQPFSPDVLADLRARIRPPNQAELVETTGDDIARALSAVIEKVGVAGRDAGDYGRTLSRASGELGAELSPGDLRKYVDSLIDATRAMETRTVTLEGELQRSADEIHALKNQLQDVRKESMTDALTNIANRKAFDLELADALNDARSSGEATALLMCDIDNFKRFNDNWGHQAGDQVLRLVAGCMSESVKGRDMVARFGGEEFAIILRRTRLDDATAIAEQIRAYVQSKKLLKKSTGDILGTITVSIGVSQAMQGDTPATLVQRADGCLYRAKHAGRNRVVSQGGDSRPQIDAAE